MSGIRKSPELQADDVKLARTMLFDINNLTAAGKSELAVQLIARTLAAQRVALSQQSIAEMRLMWCMVRERPGFQAVIDASTFHQDAVMRTEPAVEVGPHCQRLHALRRSEMETN
jgi:hypothetical protein